MDAIALHKILVERDAFHEELDPGNLECFGRVPEYCLEFLRVPGAVIARYSDSEQYHGGTRVLARRDDRLEVLAHSFRRETAKPVVTAELEDDQFRLEIF